MSTIPQQHTISVLVQNEAGTINRLVSLFRRRGFSLASFNAGDCEDPGFSRITLVVNGDELNLRQCMKQLDKLIDVVEVEDLPQQTSVQRETMLARLAPAESQRDELYKLVSEFYAKTPKATKTEVVVEFSGEVAELEHLLGAIKPFNVLEVVRTGVVAIKLA